MLNKNDPLIGAVQQIMHKSNVEREATRLVNEAFGIEDRKALPHEYQAEWDSVYQQVLSESNIDHPNKRKLDVAKPYGRLTKKDFSTLRAMGEEEQIDEKTIASKKVKKGTKYKVKAKRPDSEGSYVELRQGKRVKDSGDYDRGARAFFMKTGTYGSAEDILRTVKEEIAYNLAEQAEYVYENYGEEGLVEFINSLTEDQNDIISHYFIDNLDESTWWDTIKNAFKSTIGNKTPQPGAASDKRPEAQQPGSQPNVQAASSPVPKYTGNVKYTPKSAESQRAASTTGQGKARQQAASITPGGTSSSMGQQTGSGTTAAKPPKPIARPADLNTKLKKKVAPKAAAPKAAAPQPKKKLTFFQKQELRRSEKNDTMDQTKRLKKRYGVMEQIQNIIAERMSPSSGGQGGVNAPSIRQQNAQGPRRAATGDVAPQAQQGAGRVGAVIRTNAERIASRTGQNKSFDASYNAAAGTSPRNSALDQSNSQSPMAKAIANKGVPTNMSGGGGDYRKAQASPIKVSDTEVMNDPKYKKAVSSVGGNAGAKKIQAGERVAGLGRFNKGDTITSRVRTDIAARKNVGREL